MEEKFFVRGIVYQLYQNQGAVEPVSNACLPQLDPISDERLNQRQGCEESTLLQGEDPDRLSDLAGQGILDKSGFTRTWLTPGVMHR